MSKIGKKGSVLLLVVLSISTGCLSYPDHLGGLGDRSYKLVKFTGRDRTVTMRDEDEKAKYTVAFTNDGKVKVRFDCESGHGTWTLTGRNQLVFGPLFAHIPLPMRACSSSCQGWRTGAHITSR